MIARIVECSRDAAQDGVDAMVIGCFYDPGIDDAGETSGSTVVVAPCGSCLSVASQLGNRFSILVGRRKWVDQMHERVKWYGLADRVASYRCLDMGVDEFQCDIDRTCARIIEEARRAVDEDHAEAIILCCRRPKTEPLLRVVPTQN